MAGNGGKRRSIGLVGHWPWTERGPARRLEGMAETTRTGAIVMGAIGLALVGYFGAGLARAAQVAWGFPNWEEYWNALNDAGFGFSPLPFLWFLRLSGAPIIALVLWLMIALAGLGLAIIAFKSWPKTAEE